MDTTNLHYTIIYFDTIINYLTHLVEIYKRIIISLPLPIHIPDLIREKHKTRTLWKAHRSAAVKKRLIQLMSRVNWELDNHRYNSYKTYQQKFDSCNCDVANFEFVRDDCS